MALRFPSSAHEIDEPAPELVDTEIAGVVVTFLDSHGERRGSDPPYLRRAIRELDVLLPQLEGEAADYFARLRLIAIELLR